MPKYIVSQPAITLCIESRSSRLPTTTSAPMARNPCARSSSFRTIARTALPCLKSSSVTVRPTAPTRPAAPVTRMGFAMFFPLKSAHLCCAYEWSFYLTRLENTFAQHLRPSPERVSRLPDKRGGLNGSTQHFLEVYSLESE